jgi:CMP-N-acetylneuraminic acid synthetase
MILNNILFIIPARKNSIRLKNKNIKKIGGKALVQWSIDFALSLKNYFLDVIVSTDSKKIIQISKTNHILFIKRKRNISTKDSRSEDVILDALYWYKKNYINRFKKIEAVALLQPTSPFRSRSLFIKAFKFFIKNKADNIFSTTLVKKNYQFLFLKKKKYSKPNGNFYITRLNFFLKKKNLFSGNSYECIIKNKNLIVDIDTLKDYQKAKKIFKDFKNNNN